MVFLAAKVDDRDAAIVPAPFGSGSAGPGDLPGCGHGGHLHQGPGGADRGDQPGLVTVDVVSDQVIGLEPDRMHGEEGRPRGGEDALGDGPVGAGECPVPSELDPR